MKSWPLGLLAVTAAVWAVSADSPSFPEDESEEGAFTRCQGAAALREGRDTAGARASVTQGPLQLSRDYRFFVTLQGSNFVSRAIFWTVRRHGLQVGLGLLAFRMSSLRAISGENFVSTFIFVVEQLEDCPI